MFRNVTDWPRVVNDLVGLGINCKQIAREFAAPKASTIVVRYRNDEVEPSHSRGEAIITLWMNKTGKPREELPKTNKLPASRTRTRGAWKQGSAKGAMDAFNGGA